MIQVNSFPHIFNYIEKSLFPGVAGDSSHECNAKMEIDGKMVDVDLMELIKDEELCTKIESMVKGGKFQLSEELVKALSAQKAALPREIVRVLKRTFEVQQYVKENKEIDLEFVRKLEGKGRQISKLGFWVTSQP
jgi:hypothetical protein